MNDSSQIFDPGISRPGDSVGGVFGRKTGELIPRDAVFRYFAGNFAAESDRLKAEELKTRSYRCGGVLEKPGDVMVIWEKDAFDGRGNYCTCIYYVEMPPAKKAEKAAAEGGPEASEQPWRR